MVTVWRRHKDSLVMQWGVAILGGIGAGTFAFFVHTIVGALLAEVWSGHFTDPNASVGFGNGVMACWWFFKAPRKGSGT